MGRSRKKVNRPRARYEPRGRTTVPRAGSRPRDTCDSRLFRSEEGLRYGHLGIPYVAYQTSRYWILQTRALIFDPLLGFQKRDDRIAVLAVLP